MADTTVVRLKSPFTGEIVQFETVDQLVTSYVNPAMLEALLKAGFIREDDEQPYTSKTRRRDTPTAA